jgi:hypothetical protein
MRLRHEIFGAARSKCRVCLSRGERLRPTGRIARGRRFFSAWKIFPPSRTDFGRIFTQLIDFLAQFAGGSERHHQQLREFAAGPVALPATSDPLRIRHEALGLRLKKLARHPRANEPKGYTKASRR